MSADAAEPSLWRDRDFNVFWLGQTLSGLGDAFALVATPLLVLRATGSLHKMGTLTALVAVAHVLSGLVSGAVVDRVDRRRLMIACDVGRFALYSAVPLAWWLRGPSYLLLAAAACAGAFLGNMFQVAAITAVANLVPRPRLLEANGRMHGAYAVMMFVGPMAAGEVCQRVGPVAALAVDCGSYLVSGASLLLVRARLQSDAPRERVRIVEGFASGLRFLWGTPVLRAITVLLAVSSLLLAGRENLLVFYVQRGLGGDDRAVGQVFALAALGAAVGAVGSSWLRGRFGFGACWLGGGACIGAAMLGIGVARSLPLLAGLGAVLALGEAVRNVTTMTLRQEITPDPLLGRVTAAFWALLTVPAALGAEVNARLAERFGVERVVLGVGAGLLVVVLVGALGPIGRASAPRA